MQKSRQNAESLEIHRELEIDLSRSFFLFGPRQVGKTTFLKTLIPKNEALFFNFLHHEVYSRYLTRPDLFRKEIEQRDPSKRFIVADEIQKVPSLLNEVHYLIEETKSPPIFCLSGSSARKLKRGQANLLAGRATTYNLYPLSFRELAEKFDLDLALNYGLLPYAYLHQSRDFLQSYVETYLEEEIKAEALTRNLHGFINFLRVVAEHNGELINYSNLARETGNSRAQIKEFFQILEDTLVGYFLFSYSKSVRQKLVQHPKFYFFDIGVVRAIRKQLNYQFEMQTPEYGKAFEQFIILELMKFSRYRKLDLTFSFYRTAAGAEVDLIVETPRAKTIAIEIKSQASPTLSRLKGLFSFAENNAEAELVCACLTPRAYKEKNILILPWQELFDFLLQYK